MTESRLKGWRQSRSEEIVKLIKLNLTRLGQQNQAKLMWYKADAKGVKGVFMEQVCFDNASLSN